MWQTEADLAGCKSSKRIDAAALGSLPVGLGQSSLQLEISGRCIGWVGLRGSMAGFCVERCGVVQTS